MKDIVDTSLQKPICAILFNNKQTWIAFIKCENKLTLTKSL